MKEEFRLEVRESSRPSRKKERREDQLWDIN